MNKNSHGPFGVLVFLSLLVWGPIASAMIGLVYPSADAMQLYLVTKGTFAVALLGGMHVFGGLPKYGFQRGAGWWFLVPSLPFLLLTVAIFFDPNARFGLGPADTMGWIWVAIFVGIGEECVFRGVLWRVFESRGVLFTACTTSILFGAVHLVGLMADIPWQIVVSQAFFAFGVGMTFAAVRAASGSLLAPIVLHAVFDAGAIVAAGGINAVFDEVMTVGRLVGPGVVFALWGLICILFIEKQRLKRTAGQRTETPPPSAASSELQAVSLAD